MSSATSAIYCISMLPMSISYKSHLHSCVVTHCAIFSFSITTAQFWSKWTIEERLRSQHHAHLAFHSIFSLKRTISLKIKLYQSSRLIIASHFLYEISAEPCVALYTVLINQSLEKGIENTDQADQLRELSSTPVQDIVKNLPTRFFNNFFASLYLIH